MRTFKPGTSGVVLILALAAASQGCLSMQNSVDAITESMSTQPYVEAYIEYAGPQARWAGPSSFVLHVNAKQDTGPAELSVTPALFKKATPAPTTANSRAPASAPGPALTGEAAREQLAHLATALQGASEAFRGCLSPVRVRLIRADGGLVEKQGCRGQNGWSRVASEAVDHFIAAATQ